jgi:hypothetical protein
MSTTNNTTGSNQSSLTFNPQAQSLYNQFVGQGGGILSGFMNSPFSNSFYNQGAQMTQQGAAAAGANNVGANKQAALTGGLNSSWQGATGAQTGRANQAMTSQGNINNVLQALQRQMGAAGTGLSFSPQLMGQSGSFANTSSIGGLGSWLPQMIASMAGSQAMSSMKTAQPQTGTYTGGSVNGVSDPALNSPQYMPGGGPTMPPPSLAGMGSGGLQGMLGSNASSMNPYYASMFMPQ